MPLGIVKIELPFSKVKMEIIMLVSKEHMVTGKINTLDLDVTHDQLIRWRSGEHIQKVMPHLSAEEREFLISGLLPGEYDKLFKEQD